MPLWVTNIIVALFTKLGSWLLSKGLEKYQKREKKIADEADIDARVALVKEAIMESKDGTPLTPEQRQKFKDAVSNLIRGGNNGGL